MSTTVVKPFSFYNILEDGRVEFFVDATLLKDFSICEKYFEERHINNRVPKGHYVVMPFPMAIGCWWSDVMELFYNRLRDGLEVTPEDVKDFALQAWAHNNLDACSLAEPEKFESFGDLAGSVLMLLDYYNSQYLDDKRLWKIISIEEGFGLKKEVKVGETKNIVVYWVGRPDLVALEDGRLSPVDHKTVSRVDGYTTDRWKPSEQFPGYALAAEEVARGLGFDYTVDRCIVNICSRSRPSEKPRSGKKRPRFIRAYPNFNRDEIAEWRVRVINKCERIAFCLKNGGWVWNETACSNFYMRDCNYKKAHAAPPLVREILYKTDFEPGRIWKPYEPEVGE